MDPSLIGKYRVERRLGQGGMGTVYLAHDTRIGRHVAIKLLRVDDEETRQRFELEAQSAGRLKHPNIVTIYDYGDYEGNPCLVMEYVEGDTLAAMIGRAPSPSFSQRLDLMEQVCRGLGYAHRAGIVHRDIKPSNLMVDGAGVMKVLDFGIARMAETGMTRVGHVVGTAAYMSPEQVRGERVDARSDIFAVGLVLYEFLTGKRAFPGDNDFAIYNRILTGTAEPFTHPDPRLAASMSQIFETVLAKDPARRYQEVETLGADLARVRRSLPPETTGSTTIVPAIARPSATPPPKALTPRVVPPTPVVPPSPTPQRERPSDPRSPTPRNRPPWEPNPRAVTPPLPLTPARASETNAPANGAEPFELTLRMETPAHPVPGGTPRAASAVDPGPSGRGMRSMAALVAAGVVLVALIVAGIAYFSPGVLDFTGRDPAAGDASGEPGTPPIPPGSRQADPGPPPAVNAAAATPTPPAVQPPKKEDTPGAPPAADTRRPRVDPRTIENRLTIAARLFEEGQYDRAIAEYDAILRDNPRNAAATEALAQVRQAKAAEQKVLLARHIAERVAEGKRFYSEGLYDAAIAAYQAALRLDPNDQPALDGIAQARKAKTPD